MNPLPQKFALDTFKSLGDRAFFGQSTFGVIISWIMLFCVILSLLFVGRGIQNEDKKTQISQLYQQTEQWADSFNLRLSNDAEQLSQIIQPFQGTTASIYELSEKSRNFMHKNPEILEIFFLDANNKVLDSFASPHPSGDLSLLSGEHYQRQESLNAISRARRNQSVTFGQPYVMPLEGSPFVDLIISTNINHQKIVAVCRISIWMLLKDVTRHNTQEHYQISVLSNHEPIISATTITSRQSVSHEVPLFPLSQNVTLRVSTVAYGLLTQNYLFWIIISLGIFLILTLIALIRFNMRQNQIESTLRAETALRKAMSDSQVSGLWVSDLNGRIVYANKTLCQMLKMESNETLIGQMPPYSFWPQGHESFKLMELLHALLNHQLTRANYECFPVTADGSNFAALLNISPLLSAEGTQLGWLSVLTDITDIQKAQQALSEAHIRFMRVLESMQSAVSVVDKHTNELLFFNKAYHRLFGQSSLGHQAIHAEKEHTCEDSQDISDVFLDNRDLWLAVQERDIVWTARPSVRLQIATDITQKRRNELFVAEQQARSEQNSRLVTMGEMASSLAHELNQPLTAISNYAFVIETLMKKAGVPPEHEMFLSIQRISAQSQRAAGIIQRIRSFTKRSEPKMENISTHTLVNEVMELAQIAARRHHAKLYFNISEDATEVFCDSIMIEQVLLNLIKNGIEAASTIQAQVPYVRLDIYQKDQHIIFEVRDNGTGISPEHKAKLFDPFFTTKSSGMGMGLNICRTIVELHHGRLSIQDNEPHGSIFSLTLPIKNG